MKQFLKKLVDGETLSESEAQRLMDALLASELAPEQVGFMLACLEFRSPTGEELAGFTQSLLRRSLTLEAHANSMDVCGTGGDGLGMFNVSTCVSFVVAAGGVKVAKHGNRAISSRCGSFDVLEALNIPVAQSPAEAELSLRRSNLAFLFAPNFHPILGTLAPIRRNLGVRTVLNALGPLLNPARVKRQLIGVYSKKILVPMAEALRLLGTEEAMIVHGADGSDEISLHTLTHVVHLKDGHITEGLIDPRELGMSGQDLSHLAGGEALENALILEAVLKGDKGAHRDITLLNAGAAFTVAGKVSSLEEGVTLAAQVIDRGLALNLLRSMQREDFLKAIV